MSQSALSNVPNSRRWIILALFLGVVYFPLFLHLDHEPVKNFDEALFANRAFSIAYYGEYLCNFRELPYGPSASNTKPPLISFVQALSFWIFGYNELALRLPIAISAVLLLLMFLRFSQREFGSWNYGFIAGLVLITAHGWVNIHTARTGDHDVPLAIFNWIVLICWYRYLQYDGTRKKYIYGLALALTCAVLTKNIAGLFFGPALLIYTLYKRKLGMVLRDKHLYLAAGVFILLTGGYYLYRILDCPSFFDRMWRYEMGGHYGATRDGHDHPWYWYVNNLYVNRFRAFLPLIPLSLILVFAKPFRKMRDLGVILILGTASVLILISGSSTKLIWYDATAFPPLAMLVGLVLWQLYEGLMDRWKPAHQVGRYMGTLGFLLIFFLFPYMGIMKYVYLPKQVRYESERYANLIWQTERNRPDIKEYAIIHLGQSAHALFYQNVYNLTRDDGYHIRRFVSAASARSGQVVMACQKEVIWELYANYEIEVIQAWNGCQIVRLLPKEVPAEEQATGENEGS